MKSPFSNIHSTFANDYQKFNGGQHVFNHSSLHDLMSPFINDESVRSKLLSDEIYPCKVIDDCLFLYDTVIGMPYALKEGRAYCVYDYMFSSQHDILEANFIRALLNRQKHKSLPRILSTCNLNIKSLEQEFGTSYKGLPNAVLFNEIPTYIVHNRDELNERLSFISALAKRKLWYRGQTKEYTYSRNLTTIKLLELPETYIETPSLVPSLGRIRETIGGHWIKWMEAFNIWVISQNKVKAYTRYKEKILSCLSDPVQLTRDVAISYVANRGAAEYISKYPEEFVDILKGDPFLYDAGTLCMQQYGLLTSMLDVTEDLDIALYFTQAVIKNGIYNKVTPSGRRFLYIFADMPTGVTTLSSHQLFTHIPWKVELPLRLARQQCGLLYGADMSHRNTYAHRIIAKIIIDSDTIISTKDTKYLFPDTTQDYFFKLLGLTRPKLRGLYG